MATQAQTGAAAFAGTVDLAAERVGGKTLLASDEFFAEKENLLKPGRGIFIPDKYTENGKWMDGWESRRKRVSGYDWCILKLGLSGVITGVDIDTNHFLGNNPAYASVDACVAPPDATAETLTSSGTQWTEILPRSPLNPGSQNIFSVLNLQPNTQSSSSQTWTHVRLNIYPDGGVARFRVLGVVTPNWSKYKQGDLIDLAAIENGGQATACSDMFFSAMDNLIMPGRSTFMGDGWETKRRRGPGYDWIILKLGRAGHVCNIEVDTNHFKGNYPDMCSIDGCYAPDKAIDRLTWAEAEWKELLPKTKLQAHTQHYYEQELVDVGICTHVRLNIYPDGGVSRLRVWGTL